MRVFACAATCALLAFGPSLFAANPSDDFYDAIRRDDVAAVQKLLASGVSVNLKDDRGGTPLMYAAAVGSEAMMRRLIEAGADVNARNAFDSTALLFCTNSLSRVKLLLDHGAGVNVRSKRGHTPIALAAKHAGSVDILKLMLAKGATLDIPPDADGDTPLSNAAFANDTAAIRLLIQSNKSVLGGPAGPMAILNAASFGNVEVVKLLLAHGVDVNSQSPAETSRVKNGPIAIGSLTPLVLAVTSGSPETVRILLDAGAKIDMPDVRGMTPLMLAVATDHPNHDILRTLLAHHPDTRVKSKAGETALDWALKFKQPEVLAAIRAASDGVTPSQVAPASAPAAPTADVRAALQRSAALLQSSGTTMFREGGCVSCHGGNIVSSATAAARRAGIRIDEAAAAEMLKATRLQFAARADGFLQREDGPAIEILTYAIAALADEGAPPDRIIDAMVNNIAAQQLASGQWERRGIVRPPTSDGAFTNTAFAIRALRVYAPPARRAEYDERIARAARALSSAEPSTTEDCVTQLLGLTWAGAEAAKVASATRRVSALQREDGGWSQTPYLPPDAFATATALHALHEAGLPGDSPVHRKGVAFLLKTQAADGSWHVASRAPKFQPYFEGGFPYGHDQWISQWATGWATVAIADSMR